MFAYVFVASAAFATKMLPRRKARAHEPDPTPLHGSILLLKQRSLEQMLKKSMGVLAICLISGIYLTQLLDIFFG